MSFARGYRIGLTGFLAVAPLLGLGPVGPTAPTAAAEEQFTDRFRLDECEFETEGENAFFILLPGTQQVYEGSEDGEKLRLTITVTNQTRQVNGVRTRVVEERETVDGEVSEVSRNYFAICDQTNSVFYFGEQVDFYEDGKIVNHDGSWQAGSNRARAGLMMPGLALLGARYYQEVAPRVAEDRAEIVSLSETVNTPAGTFKDVLKTEESTPLEPGVKEYKFYAPGVGLVRDGPLKLVSFKKGQSAGDD
jgi:hypothetical protein